MFKLYEFDITVLSYKLYIPQGQRNSASETIVSGIEVEGAV